MRTKWSLITGGVAIVLGAAIIAGLELDATNQMPLTVQSSQVDEALSESDTVAAKVGERYYAIPVNVLASPLEGGREGKFLTDQSVLLDFFWPTMRGRTGASDKGTASTGRVRVLMYSVRGGSDPQLALISRFNGQVLTQVTSHTVTCTDPLLPQSCPELYAPEDDKLRQLPDSNGRLHFERYDFPNRDPNFMSDIFIEISGSAISAFSVCTQPSTKRPGTICTLHFVDDSNWFHVTFDYRRIPLDEIKALRSAILRQIEQFERAGRRIKNSTIGGSE